MKPFLIIAEVEIQTSEAFTGTAVEAATYLDGIYRRHLERGDRLVNLTAYPLRADTGISQADYASQPQYGPGAASQ